MLISLSIITSVIVAMVGWRIDRKNKEVEISIKKLNKIIPITQDLIDFINKTQHKEYKIKETDILEAGKNLKDQIEKAKIDFLGSSEKTMDIVIECSKDFEHLEIDKEISIKEAMLLVYSVVNLTFRLLLEIHREKDAKRFIQSIFPVGNDVCRTITKYNDLREEFRLNTCTKEIEPIFKRVLPRFLERAIFPYCNKYGY